MRVFSCGSRGKFVAVSLRRDERDFVAVLLRGCKEIGKRRHDSADESRPGGLAPLGLLTDQLLRRLPRFP